MERGEGEVFQHGTPEIVIIADSESNVGEIDTMLLRHVVLHSLYLQKSILLCTIYYYFRLHSAGRS